MNEQDWDRVAISFEKEIFNVPANDRKGLIAAAVARHADPDGVAADIGCGIGRTVSLLAAHFRMVVASDVSSECLAIASHRNKVADNVTYHHADLVESRPPGPAAHFALCINTLLLADADKRSRMMGHVCSAVRKGGHLLLVVPSIESVLLTHARHAEWRSRVNGRATEPGSASDDSRELLRGVVRIDRVPTKHYLKEELHDLLAGEHMEVVGIDKIEYPWSTEFQGAPRWMKDPCLGTGWWRPGDRPERGAHDRYLRRRELWIMYQRPRWQTPRLPQQWLLQHQRLQQAGCRTTG